MFVALAEPVKLSILTLDQPLAAAAAHRVVRLQRVDARCPQAGRVVVRRHRVGGRRPGPSSRATPTTTSSGSASPLPPRARASSPLPATAWSSSAATARSSAPPRSRSPKLSNRFGAGLDPCAALHAAVELAPGETRQIVFLLGQGRTRGQARELVRALRHTQRPPQAELGAVESFWDETLGSVRVSTPDDSFDLLVNRWLLYQDLSCRIWARSGYYQASGAYRIPRPAPGCPGPALTRPDLAREHILRAAARQFVEGDVQHWWDADHRTGHPDALLGRSPLAPLCRRALRRLDRRPRRARRAHPVPGSAAARSR